MREARVWAEPYKIKMIEPVHMTSREDRERYIVEAGYNTFLLKSKATATIGILAFLAI